MDVCSFVTPEVVAIGDLLVVAAEEPDEGRGRGRGPLRVNRHFKKSRNACVSREVCLRLEDLVA